LVLAAFYRGLGAELSAATTTLRRRDRAIAAQLAGATPEEAEAYARETNIPLLRAYSRGDPAGRSYSGGS
jgi:hypothetical protein